MEAKIPSTWPFGLDVLKKQYNRIPTQRILAAQAERFNELGPNMKLKLLGQDKYFTIDPKNIESILSSRFEGTHQLPYSHLLLSSAKITSLRLELGQSARRPLSPSRRRNLHSRRPILETLQRNPPSSIRADPISETERLRRECQRACFQPLSFGG
jgi:hypothetical protein